MKIFIMRHGEADVCAASDAERPLTARGQSDSVAVAKTCQAQYGALTIDKVLVSPYLRAQQTWQEIENYCSAHDVQSCDDITPYGQAEDVVEYVLALAEHESLESVMLVSHLPLVGYLVAEFVVDIPAPMFTPSTLYCIEYDVVARRGEVLWSVRP
ncbi:phosphohistidine phosphatase SixA [Vibrio zhugei]|uniref:Phosphohistidine phosphatase SixA n=1 Tax=Vibrio zhugei TaxID=2479546 RepID=A0ABV7CC03_9VIBR|nr:phosphohistidine phosphatase SixA [Vibrio zhugei]